LLRSTFVHLPGVGLETERRLWSAGVHDWDAALGGEGAPRGISAARWDALRELLEESRSNLGRREHRFFAERLKMSHHWRGWKEFRDRAGFLDIETTGMGAWATVTVVGVYDGVRVHTFIHGENLDELPEFLERFAMLVTFNGATFDLPFLRRRFRGLRTEQLHYDLRYPLAKLGLRGGLKAIEGRLGIARDDDLQGLSGDDAVRLWNEYARGDEHALDLLVRYNAADVVNLEPLAEYAYDELWRRCRAACAGAAER
jgi:uncharacterized protein YprB with RNaseH-like and TPR domain